MAHQAIVVAVIAVFFFAIRYLNCTDVPKIKNLPEIPGIPIFGNLLQLGNEHAKNAAAWVKQYGPVFQVRLGNKVCTLETYRSAWHQLMPDSRESYMQIVLKV